MPAKEHLPQQDERSASVLDRLLDGAPADDEPGLDNDLTRQAREQADRGETIPHAQVRRELLGA